MPSAPTLEQLRICVVGPIPPPAGGMANLTAEIVERLRAEGAQVERVAVNPAYRPQWARHLRGIRALFRLFPYLWQLCKAIRHADVVHLMANSGWSWHLHAVPAIWIAYFLRTPLILNYHGGQADSFFKQSWRWIQPSMRRVSAVIVPSGFLELVFSRYGIATAVIPNCIDTELFSPNENVVDFGAVPRLLITRNLEKIYGIDLAIEALPQILKTFANARLYIAGSGPEKSNMQQQVTQLGLEEQVTFTGRLNRAEIATLYRSSTVLLNPSRVDNAPLSIIEALACGLPVVSSRAGGIPLLVKDTEQAVLVDVGSSQALAEAAIKLLRDPAAMQRLRVQGPLQAAHFSWTQIRPQLLGCYQQVLHRPSRAPQTRDKAL